MRLRLLLALPVMPVLGVLVPATLPGQEAPRPSPLALTHAVVIDAGGPRPDLTVLVRGDRIVAVGPAARIPVPRDARVVDATGKYLIPGLWDMHVHLTFFGSARLSLFLVHGVTGVRDLGGIPDSIFRWRRAIDSGALAGPRIVAAGLTLSGPAGRGGRSAPHIALVTTPAEARQAVRENRRLGADLIKVWSTIPRDAYFAAADEARRLGLMLVGHIPVDVSLAEALESGQRGIEHLIGVPIALTAREPAELARLRDEVHRAPDVGAQVGAMLRADVRALGTPDPAVTAAVLNRLTRAGVWVCPTLTDTHAYTVMQDSLPADPRLRYLPRMVRAQWLEEAKGMPAEEVAAWRTIFPAALRLVGEMRRAGVRLIAGTDAGSTYDLPGFDLHNELALLVRAGLSPLEALTAATRDAAQAVGWQDRSGTVAVGKLADLVLLEANPLADIGNTRRIANVVARGRLLDAAELERMRRGLEAR